MHQPYSQERMEGRSFPIPAETPKKPDQSDNTQTESDHDGIKQFHACDGLMTLRNEECVDEEAIDSDCTNDEEYIHQSKDPGPVRP